MIYKTAKLVTGELVAFTTDQEITSNVLNAQKYIDIVNPVAFYSFRFLEDGKLSEVVGMQPWVPIAPSVTTEEVYLLSVQSIVTITDMDPRAIISYEEYISRQSEPEDMEYGEEEEEEFDEEVYNVDEQITKLYH
jgi:hypothetical protein